MTRGWRLPPAAEAWPAGPTRDTEGGVGLRAPGPSGAQVHALVDLLEAGGRALARIPVREVARVLGAVGERFTTEGDPLRTRALSELPGAAGISPAQAVHVVDGMARDWTTASLVRLLEGDFDEVEVLDGFRPAPLAGEPLREVRAHPLAPAGRVAVHVCSGTVPGVSVNSLLRNLLVKGPVLLKPGTGDALLPLLVLDGLHQCDDEVAGVLSQAAAVAWWPGGSGGALEAVALERAGALVVYGGDDTVAELRGRVGPGVPVVDYPHRISFAVVGGTDPVASGRALARAVAAYDQRGCASPQQALVIGGAEVATAVAEAAAAGLDALDRTLPPGPPDAARASAVQQLRGTAEMRAATGEGVHLLQGPGTRWTVVLDPAEELRPSCLSRTVHVTPVPSADAVARILAPVAAHLQGVGTSGLTAVQETEVAAIVSRLGASRVAPLGDLAFPGPGWRHDGQGPLRRLVRWSGWERSVGGDA